MLVSIVVPGVRGRAAECRAAVESHDMAGGHRADGVALDAVTGAWLMDRERAAGDLAGARAGNDGSETPRPYPGGRKDSPGRQEP
jgi:hypothetical protein